MFCSECGKEIEEGAKFCGACGTPITESNDKKAIRRAKRKKAVSNVQETAGEEHRGGSGCLFPLLIGGFLLLGALITNSTGVFWIELLLGIGVLFWGIANR